MTSHEKFKCPRREEAPPGWLAQLDEYDTWLPKPGTKGTCSYCGSMHPDEFMALVIAGEAIGTTTKNYKAYIREHEKFYYQHLSVDQGKMLVTLYNARKTQFEVHDGILYGWGNPNAPFPYFFQLEPLVD